ncbi:MAG: hypothetical protein HUK40_09180 [Desulfobacter sp.]|nr:hypothetical protein [Desulfobacter sp.]
MTSHIKLFIFPPVMNPDAKSVHADAQKTADTGARIFQAPGKKGAHALTNADKGLITLAVKCRLIPADQKNALIDTFEQKRRTRPDFTAEQLFKETQPLSDEDIEFLFAVRHHLEMKMLDKKFGELGVANRFVQAKSVKKALDIQSTIFKESNQSKLIGDILLENQEISKADKAAILLTQDRIKEDLLSEAMNDIAVSKMDKISLNMRFGAIAIKKQFISIDQLNQALRVQEKKAEETRAKPYLGLVLKELFGLEEQKLSRILQIQKEMEKKDSPWNRPWTDTTLKPALTNALPSALNIGFQKTSWPPI